MRQENNFSGRMVNREKLKALIDRGSAVVKKAMKIKEQVAAFSKPRPKKMRKSRISLDAAFEKEKKSHGKRKK